MKKTFHKIRAVTSLALAVLLMLGTILSLASCGKNKADESFALPTRSLAEDAPELEYGLYKYKVYDDNTVIITAYSGSEISVTIPDKIDGKPVVEIANAVFLSQTQLKTLKLGKNVEIIGEMCFADCTSLYDITFNKKLWSIGSWAFKDSPWLNTQSDEFVIVGDSVLIKYNGNASAVVIPDNVKHVVDAFEGNENLVSVDMSDNMLTLGDYAFAYCSNLRLVRFSSNLRSIGNYTFNECGGLTSLELPDKVERIGAFAFCYCGALTSVNFGKSLKVIDREAFYSCVKIRVLTIPSTLTEIGTYAFKECNSVMIVYYDGTEAQLEAISGLSDNTTNSTVWNARKYYVSNRAQ